MAQIHKYSVLLPLLLFVVLVASLLLQLNRSNTFEFAAVVHRRSLQEASSTSSSSSCDVLSQPKDLQVPATFVASYPGSGAKLTWKLVRAITGIYTGDDHDHNGRLAKGTAVAIKTHYPSHSPGEVFHSEKLRDIKQAILLIRNPLRALPSYHNFLYEKKEGLLNHSTRAPVEAWIQWRNEFFVTEMTLWADHIKWWMDNFYKIQQGSNNSNNNYRLKLLVFEYLTSPSEGTKELSGLFTFFATTHPVIQDNMVPDHQINCIWDMFVKGTVPGEKERRKSLRSNGPSDYPYTTSQLDLMSTTLRQLNTDYNADFPPLGDALAYYLAEIEQVKAKIQTAAA